MRKSIVEYLGRDLPRPPELAVQEAASEIASIVTESPLRTLEDIGFHVDVIFDKCEAMGHRWTAILWALNDHIEAGRLKLCHCVLPHHNRAVRDKLCHCLNSDVVSAKENDSPHPICDGYEAMTPAFAMLALDVVGTPELWKWYDADTLPKPDHHGGRYPIRDLAKKYGVDRSKLDSKLKLLRKNTLADPNREFEEVETSRKNEAKYLYREGPMVMRIIRDLTEP